jgi:hypothetical protein
MRSPTSPSPLPTARDIPGRFMSSPTPARLRVDSTHRRKCGAGAQRDRGVGVASGGQRSAAERSSSRVPRTAHIGTDLCTCVPMQPRVGFSMTRSRCPSHSLFHKSPLLQLAFATRADVPRWRAPGQGMQGRREGVIAALFGRLRTPQRAVRPAPPVGRGGEGSGRQKARSTSATSQLPSCPRARPSK